MYAKLKKEGRINKHPVHGHKLADNMIIKIHGTLHLAMETAIEKNLIAKNPTEGTTVPNKEKDFVPQLKLKNCGQNNIFAKFEVKQKPQKPLGY